MSSRACLLAACLVHGSAAVALADVPSPRTAALRAREPLAAPAPSAAVDLARDKLAALDYEDALHLLDAAWRRGGSDPALAGAIAELAARAAASLDDVATARRWYRQWLCLDPRAALPGGASPVLHAAFDAARGELGAHWLRAEARRTGDLVAVTVVDDPCSQAAAVRDGERRAPLHAGAASLRGSAAPAIDIVDGYGNTVATIPVALGLVALGLDGPPHSWYRRPVTWGIAGGATAVLGAASLYVAVDARNQLRSLSATSAASTGFYDATTAPLQQRFDRFNTAGTLLAGAAILATGVAVILWLRDPDGATRAHAGATAAAPAAAAAAASAPGASW